MRGLSPRSLVCSSSLVPFYSPTWGLLLLTIWISDFVLTNNEAAGTSDQRDVRWTYHPLMNRPLSRKEASVLGPGDKETIWDYDDDYDSEPNEAPTGLISRILEKGHTRNAGGQSSPTSTSPP